MRVLAVLLLVSPAAFFTTALILSRIVRLRLSCLRAGRLSRTLTVARRVLRILKRFRPTTRTRAAVMFADSVRTPVVAGSPLTSTLTTPLLLTLTLPKRGRLGRVGAGGGGGGDAEFGIASA